ncbi:MAG: hypothetical protein RLZZ423_1939 [Cyanobacteriota bacterium]|jgi:hypothetical protein
MKNRLLRLSLLRLSLLLLSGAVACGILYRWIGVRVEANGLLREPFALIPIGYLLAFAGMGTGIAGLLGLWLRQRR